MAVSVVRLDGMLRWTRGVFFLFEAVAVAVAVVVTDAASCFVCFCFFLLVLLGKKEAAVDVATVAAMDVSNRNNCSQFAIAEEAVDLFVASVTAAAAAASGKATLT